VPPLAMKTFFGSLAINPKRHAKLNKRNASQDSMDVTLRSNDNKQI
jgi:hypothetical protein